MGSEGRVVISPVDSNEFARIKEPVGLTTPMMSDDGTGPVWIEAPGVAAATFNDHSARHENGGADEISLAGLDGMPAELAAHVADTADAHDASAISVSPTVSGGADVQAALVGLEAAIGGGGHAEGHDHDGSPTEKLAQANTHELPDTDVGPTSLHRTLGTGANQAAAGNHGHLGEGRPTGAYLLPGNTIVGVPAAATLGAGNRYYQPILVREEIELTGLIAEVVAGEGAGRAMRGGLYHANELWQPSALVKEGAFDASTAGVKTINVSPSIVLPPGRYVSVMETNNATPTWRLWQTNPWWATTGANGMVRHLQVSATTYGALPDPGAAWDAFLAGTTPTNHRVLLRVDP